MAWVFRKIFKVDFLKTPLFFCSIGTNIAKSLLFFRRILKNFIRKDQNSLASMKLTGVLRKSSTNLAKKFESAQKNVGNIG